MFSSLKNFWKLNLSEYENIGIDFPIGIFFVLLCILFCVSIFVIYFHTKMSSELLTALVRHEAFDKEHAKTLKGLRVDFWAVRLELTKNNRIARMVAIKDREELTYDEYIALNRKSAGEYNKIDFDKAEIYLKPSEIETAKTIAEKQSASILTPIIISVLSFAVLYLCAKFLPVLLPLIK
jgi:hypothetical protein